MLATNPNPISPLALTGLFSKHLPPGMPWLQNPFFISNNNIAGSGPRVRVTVGSGGPPIKELIIWDGNNFFTLTNPKWLGNKGDIYFNQNPYNDGGDNRYLAWICTSSFALNPDDIDASVEATWKPFWSVNF